VINQSSSAITNRSHIQNSSRAFGVFGFGGRLCVYSRTIRHEVTVHRVCHLIPRDTLVRIEKFKYNCGVKGPLNSCDDDAVRSYIERVSQGDQDLLWSLIRIASNSRGKLRSDNGVTDDESPETNIVKLLLQTKEGNVNSANSNSIITNKTKEQVKQEDDEITRLLLRGWREEAVKESVRAGKYSLALLVALMCSREVFQGAGKEFALSEFIHGHPLCTISMLFSGNLRSDTATEFWEKTGSSVLRRSWCAHVAAILSNRVNEWEFIVIALGDRLASLGEIVPAHFCYMVCGCPVASPHLPDARLTLLGCDVKPSDLILRTDESLLALERTEAFEWSKRRGNRNATIPCLQSFKLMHAMLLADYGFEHSAFLYTQNLLDSLGSNADDNLELTLPRGSLALHVLLSNRQSLFLAVEEFEKRLLAKSNENFYFASNSTHDVDADVSFVTAQTNILNPTECTHSHRAGRLELDSESSSEGRRVSGICKEQDVSSNKNPSELQDVTSSRKLPKLKDQHHLRQLDTSFEDLPDIDCVAISSDVNKTTSQIYELELDETSSLVVGQLPDNNDAMSHIQTEPIYTDVDSLMIATDHKKGFVSSNSMESKQPLDQKRYEFESPPATTGSRPSQSSKKRPPSAPASAPANLELLTKKSPSSGGRK
jgi:Sec23-binding domain of Sec16